MDNKNAIKINNLIVALWYKILCKRFGIKWRHCYQRATLTSRSCLPALSSVGVINPENWPANAQYLNPVDFSVWGALQHQLYRQKFRDVDCLLVRSVKVLRLGKSGFDTVHGAIDQLLKRLVIVIRAQDGHAEFRLNQNVYNISVKYKFLMKCMQKMNASLKFVVIFSAVSLH